MYKMKNLKGNMFDLAELERLKNVNDRSLVAAQIFVGTSNSLRISIFTKVFCKRNENGRGKRIKR